MEPTRSNQLTVVLTDGVCEISHSTLNVLSKSSFSLCADAVSDNSSSNTNQNIVHCDYLTRSEFLSIVDVLRGKASIDTLSAHQLQFVEANLLIPAHICRVANRAQEKAAKLIATANSIQDRHVALLMGTSKVLVCDYADRKTLFESDTEYAEMYKDLKHIVPVLITCDKHGMNMIRICEGVPSVSRAHKLAIHTA